ncbi:hypothetical protein BUALT_Bualt19G0031300 [Buddleja alternifolia]|uniref:Retrotransposon gag domain-containing protein n=1 Tax=Buddleja alternifolia TaxID=168488 RepID=A0AAV6W132_9LAMI|nr:hypothetical protein BUALT_Bualt19G0031300 [Buddleja alternifolia]
MDRISFSGHSLFESSSAGKARKITSQELLFSPRKMIQDVEPAEPGNWKIACLIWDAARETYSNVNNTSAIFEIKSILHDLRQGDLTVTEYFNTLTRHWQQLDIYEELVWKCLEDGLLYKKVVEKERIYKFLLGLNKNLDELEKPPQKEQENNTPLKQNQELDQDSSNPSSQPGNTINDLDSGNIDDLDEPIALRKGVRSCTQHPISNHVS